MIEGVVDRIHGLERNEELRLLTEHVAVTSPLALDFLARERGLSRDQEAQRLAAIQLRVVTELAARLRWLESVCEDPQLDGDLRVALRGLLAELGTDIEAADATPGESVGLLESAVLFHGLLSRLRPWLPPMAVALEPDAVLDILQLGIPDYLHPVVQQRFEHLWRRFHEQRLAAATHQLPRHLGARGIEARHLRAVVNEAQVYEGSPRLPPAPRWFSPSWVNPWLASDPQSRSHCAARGR